MIINPIWLSIPYKWCKVLQISLVFFFFFFQRDDFDIMAWECVQTLLDNSSPSETAFLFVLFFVCVLHLLGNVWKKESCGTTKRRRNGEQNFLFLFWETVVCIPFAPPKCATKFLLLWIRTCDFGGLMLLLASSKGTQRSVFFTFVRISVVSASENRHCSGLNRDPRLF